MRQVPKAEDFSTPRSPLQARGPASFGSITCWSKYRQAAPYRNPGVRRPSWRCACICSSAIARCSAAIKRCWKEAPARHDARASPPDGRGGGGRRKPWVTSARNGRIHRDAGRPVLFHGDEHAPAGRASGDRDDHRPRSRGMAAARRRRRSCRWRRSNRINGHALEAHLRRRSGQELPASTGRLVPSPAGRKPQRARRHRRGGGDPISPSTTR